MYRDVKTVTPCSGWTPGVNYIDKLVWSPEVPKELKQLFEPNQSMMEQEKKKINNANARSSQRTNLETAAKDPTDSETTEEWKDIAGRTLNFLNEHVNLRGSDFPSIKEQRRNIKIKKITDSSHPCCGAYGLVAAQNLAPRQLILDYLGVVEYKSYSSTSDYVLRYGIDLSIDAEKCGNEARFFNDFRGVATGPNVCFLNYLDERTERIRVGVFVLGNKKIKKGEELVSMVCMPSGILFTDLSIPPSSIAGDLWEIFLVEQRNGYGRTESLKTQVISPPYPSMAPSSFGWSIVFVVVVLNLAVVIHHHIELYPCFHHAVKKLETLILRLTELCIEFVSPLTEQPVMVYDYVRSVPLKRY